MTRMINIAEFKERYEELLTELKVSGESLTITEDGRPIAEIKAISQPASQPAGHSMNKPLFGMLAGKIKIHGDLDEPLGEEWDAERGILN